MHCIGCFCRYICFANSIYGLRPFDIASPRYDLNPSRPAGHIECIAHIERYAYIENPIWDLYRVYTVTLQPLGSSSLPVWMPVMVS